MVLIPMGCYDTRIITFRNYNVRHWLILIILSLTACTTPYPNNSYFPYQFDATETLAENTKLVIASHNLGIPSRHYLERFEPTVDNVVKNYLKENGYQVVSSKLYDDAYQSALAQFGDSYNPSTGAINQARLVQILTTTFDQLKAIGAADAVVFTDIIEREVSIITAGDKRFAQFDGVSRRVKTQGASSSVASDFNWNESIDAASLLITIYTIDGKRILQSTGGLDLTDSVDTRKSRFERSRQILKEDDYIYEAVGIALHPFIESDFYRPGE